MKYIYYKLDTSIPENLNGPFYASSFAEMEKRSGLNVDDFAQRERYIEGNKLEYSHFSVPDAPFNLTDRIKENFAGIGCLGWALLYCPAKVLRED